ncbi:sensor histidine kinase [Mycolicibacterium aichiense]|uniref:Signal transduction histidine kinase n=1 Tax=Mycolicibacterium aichiense TaxID=1799 RepID=A0AAD1HHX3_9MYCO|nr:hypothetical protein [Mycolicibacterium aichiense]MCV7021086.1 hypothetical protein [Mycolicibacterium aichiense]BBX05662.1 hypothetical protein MAIC_04650 [Mycolicibacterium aichiense]STZ24994.1 putative signal transduction histidine kinase [Mycolicibacterium aichiense]
MRAFSERHLWLIARFLTVVRAGAILVISAATLFDPASDGVANLVFMAVLAGWSSFRIVRNAPTRGALTVDFGWAILTAALLSILEHAGTCGLSHAAPLVIVTVSVVTLAAQVSTRSAVAMLAVTLISYGWGAAQLIGWERTEKIDDLYRIAFGWIIAVVLRAVVLRVAAAVDQSHSDHLAAELANQVSEARRNFVAEQLAVLHDTAAATLLLVGQGATVTSERLAAQARRDLQILRSAPAMDSDRLMDTVALLEEATCRIGVPISITGRSELWLPGELATAICAAASEAMTNAQRHACADAITIDVGREHVVVCDNGSGFSPDTKMGNGVTESIVGRMKRAGGSATLTTGPGGTVVKIRWATARSRQNLDVDRTIEQLSAGYRIALVVLAITNLVAAVVWASPASTHRPVQYALAALAGLCALAGLPGRFSEWRWTAPTAATCLGAIAVMQQAELSAAELSTDANWSQLTIGFCLLPHTLSWSSGRAATVLIALWTVPAAVALSRSPDWSIFLAATIAACLIPQLGVAMFSSLARSAATEASRENRARLQVVGREHVAQALQREYLDRYAALVDRLTPLLTALSEGQPVTPALRRQARIESQRLRALFDEASSSNGQLLQQLQHAIGPAQDRGLEVSLHVDDDLPGLTEDAVTSLMGRVTDVLDIADSHARIVLTRADNGGVAVSVLVDVTDQHPEQLWADDSAQVVSTDTSTWVTFSTPAGNMASDQDVSA